MNVLRVLTAAVPVLMLSFAVPLLNRVEPRVFGFPFLLVWIACWVAITPLFLYFVQRLERKA